MISKKTLAVCVGGLLVLALSGTAFSYSHVTGCGVTLVCCKGNSEYWVAENVAGAGCSSMDAEGSSSSCTSSSKIYYAPSSTSTDGSLTYCTDTSAYS